MAALRKKHGASKVASALSSSKESTPIPGLLDDEHKKGRKRKLEDRNPTFLSHYSASIPKNIDYKDLSFFDDVLTECLIDNVRISFCSYSSPKNFSSFFTEDMQGFPCSCMISLLHIPPFNLHTPMLTAF